jgi:hypothetical protein
MTLAAIEIREALHRRYNKPSQGREGEQWICIEEARSGAGFDGNAGACDFLAINTWRSRGMELIGHEIKVTLSDWRRERDKPEKAEMFSRFCKSWWLVVPTELAAKIEHEVPSTWGLMTYSDKGALRERHKPTRNADVQPVPAWWWVGWLAQIDRQHKRRLPYLLEQRLKPERERMQAFMDDHANRRAAAADEVTLRIRERHDEIRRITGIDLSRAAAWELESLAKVWRWAHNADLERLRNTMSNAVQHLDEFLAADQEEASDA